MFLHNRKIVLSNSFYFEVLFINVSQRNLVAVDCVGLPAFLVRDCDCQWSAILIDAFPQRSVGRWRRKARVFECIQQPLFFIRDPQSSLRWNFNITTVNGTSDSRFDRQERYPESSGSLNSRQQHYWTSLFVSQAWFDCGSQESGQK